MVEDPTTNAGRSNLIKNQEKAKQAIYDSVKDNIISIITPLKTLKEYFETLTKFYEKKVPSQKRDLKNKLQNVKMEKDKTAETFFTKISQVRD